MALDKELVLRFITTTQPKEWKQLQDAHNTTAEQVFFGDWTELKSRGTLDVLRQGKLARHQIFCVFPGLSLNDNLARPFETNILSVIGELAHSAKNDNRDLALFERYPTGAME